MQLVAVITIEFDECDADAIGEDLALVWPIVGTSRLLKELRAAEAAIASFTGLGGIKEVHFALPAEAAAELIISGREVPTALIDGEEEGGEAIPFEDGDVETFEARPGADLAGLRLEEFALGDCEVIIHRDGDSAWINLQGIVILHDRRFVFEAGSFRPGFPEIDGGGDVDIEERMMTQREFATLVEGAEAVYGTLPVAPGRAATVAIDGHELAGELLAQDVKEVRVRVAAGSNGYSLTVGEGA